ncbi:formate dehydrogenase [Rivibacter subsaxonicus]|uniref:Secreted protein n=1 Tax=Rivibacter subsaxonicus TaxID=457575 RepID=A0A4Q7VMV4_9BURK|nr:formate dehydrogenase [Rivibacter subsaxonicus]RZT97632.1 secreted protein [Rivibacter subsaxonicus]
MDKTQSANQPGAAVGRRGLLIGAGAAGVAAVAASRLLPAAEPVEVVQAPAVAAAEERQGYQLTAHVKRYYQTAKV